MYFEIVGDTESDYILRDMDEKRNSEESESERLERLYRKAADPVLRTHLLMVWRVSLGDSVGEVAETVGYSKKWTTEIVRRYESGGVEALGDRRHGNPGARERALLDEAGQAELVEALQGVAPASLGGGDVEWAEGRNADEPLCATFSIVCQSRSSSFSRVTGFAAISSLCVR